VSPATERPPQPATPSEGGGTCVYLLGHGIAYSASPGMHNAAFRALGLDWSYRLLDVAAGELGEAVGRLRGERVGGANVTIPHKVAVLGHLDAVDGTARLAGSVNTIACREGRLVGHNTDVAGLRQALARVGLGDACGRLAVVLGGGGSARAAAVALGGARLVFVARRPQGTAELGGRVLAWDDPEWRRLSREADVLVNSTPLGRGGELPLGAEDLPRSGGVIDLVYVEGGTPLARAARAAGLACVDGWEILLAQGAAAFEIWTGRPAPLEAMRAGLGLA